MIHKAVSGDFNEALVKAKDLLGEFSDRHDLIASGSQMSQEEVATIFQLAGALLISSDLNYLREAVVELDLTTGGGR